MNQDKVNKVVISAVSTKKLRTLHGRTGITPNILARIALTISLESPQQLNSDDQPIDGMEFNGYTLFGDLETVLISLIRESNALHDRVDGALSDDIRAHINRGVEKLYPRIRTLSDIVRLTESMISIQSTSE